MTALPLLTYSIAPNTVNVSETDDSSSTCTLQISVANANPDNVSYTINSITFLIPIGDNAGALIPAGKVKKVSGWSKTSGWTIELSATSDAGTSTYASWVLSPQGTAGELTDGSQIVVTLDKVTINTKPGASQIYVYEDIVGYPLPDNVYAPLGLIVNKFEPPAALLSFGSNDAAILLGENVYLKWNSIGVAQCVLKCSNPVIELKVSNKSTRFQAPKPTRTGEANYVLLGEANGSILSHTLHTSVTVLPVPTITSFTAEPGKSAGTLNVSWKTKDATEVTLTLTGIGATPPVATFGGLPANGLNVLLSDLSPNWAGTLTLTAIGPESPKIVTQTLKIPANACALSIAVVNYAPSQFWSFYSDNLCPSPDGKKIVGLARHVNKDQFAALISEDNGNTWRVMQAEEKREDFFPRIIASTSSSYVGIRQKSTGTKNFKFYEANNVTFWDTVDECDVSHTIKATSNPIFEFQGKIWIYAKNSTNSTVVIYNINSNNSLEYVSFVSSRFDPAGLSPHEGKLVLITYNSISVSSDGKSWIKILEDPPWFTYQEAPMIPPISHNGCMWVLASNIYKYGYSENHMHLYCQCKNREWLSWKVDLSEYDWNAIEYDLSINNIHSAFIANDVLQLKSVKHEKPYTYLRIYLASTPKLPTLYSE